MEILSKSFIEHADRPALWIGGRRYDYRELREIAFQLQRTMAALPPHLPIGVLTARSVAAYAGILGSVFDQRTYLPLNVDFPLERLVKVADSAGAGAIILGANELDLGLAVQASLKTPPTLIVLDEDDLGIDVRAPLASTAIERPSANTQENSEPPAYIMFTSGTTGEPKGIAIGRTHLEAYLEGIDRLFDFRPSDRFSQFFNLSFDLSVHDLFVAWTYGASLHVPGQTELLDPVALARRQELTVWFSVPSAAALAMRFRRLHPESLPTLRHGLFCGEALDRDVARAFAAAAPKARITNLYGPTEATIAITHHRVASLPSEADAAVVPIGHAFPGQETLVLRENLSAVDPGEIGELWLGGSQVTGGYTNNLEQTAAKFRRMTFPGKASRTWYATGDLVEEDAKVGLLYRGRKDDQIKLQGHRIELGEVEGALRQAAGTPLAIVVPWPSSQPRKLIALVAAPHPPAADILAAMAVTLPPYMMPASIETATDLAFNVNGKLDRKKTADHWNNADS